MNVRGLFGSRASALQLGWLPVLIGLFASAALRAQFEPKFKEQVRADSIKLTGESLIYDITTAKAPKDTAWEPPT